MEMLWEHKIKIVVQLLSCDTASETCPSNCFTNTKQELVTATDQIHTLFAGRENNQNRIYYHEMESDIIIIVACWHIIIEKCLFLVL